MKVTIKGQVTIPKHVREVLGIMPETEIEFIEDNGRFYIEKTGASESVEKTSQQKFRRFRGIASAGMTTDEIMKLTRTEP